MAGLTRDARDRHGSVGPARVVRSTVIRSGRSNPHDLGSNSNQVGARDQRYELGFKRAGAEETPKRANVLANGCKPVRDQVSGSEQSGPGTWAGRMAYPALMAVVGTVRVDKWLWAVRVYKSRAQANDACTSNRVRVNGEIAKPATKVKVGDTIEARRRDRTIIYRVVQALDKRVGAALVPDAVEDLSPPPPERPAHDGPLRESAAFAERERGAGRPTKRDRREIQKLKERR